MAKEPSGRVKAQLRAAERREARRVRRVWRRSLKGVCAAKVSAAKMKPSYNNFSRGRLT